MDKNLTMASYLLYIAILLIGTTLIGNYYDTSSILSDTEIVTWSRIGFEVSEHGFLYDGHNFLHFFFIF